MNIASARRAGAASRTVPGLVALSLAASLIYQLVKSQTYPWNVIWKGLSVSPLAVAAAFAVPGRDGVLLAAALGLSSVGDILLDVQPQQFTAGLASFLVAHVVYIVLFLRHRAPKLPVSRAILIAALLVYAILFGNRLLPAVGGELRVAVALYLCVISGMVVTAILGHFEPWVMVGAFLFLFSDSVLAADKFLGKVPHREWLVWPTYYAAQCAIAYGVWRRSRAAG
jgi:uncharacterized membrane protein YhhN